MAAAENELLKEFKCQIHTGKAVLIAGAGVAMASTQPDKDSFASWLGLLKHGIEFCADSGTVSAKWQQRMLDSVDAGYTQELETTADDIFVELSKSQSDFSDWLAKTVGSLRATEPDTIRALADLGLPILTTNYDGLIEEVTHRPSITWQDKSQIEAVLRGDDNAILHLHGFWRHPESIIFGARSYERVVTEDTIQAYLRALSTLSTLIFVGFGQGLEDSNFGALQKWMQKTSPHSPYKHYRLVLEKDLAVIRKNQSGESRIRALSYGSNYDDLIPFLRSLKPPETHKTARKFGRSYLIPYVDRPKLEKAVDELFQKLHDDGLKVMILHAQAGTGKTRLAIERAANAQDLFPNGVHMIDLTDVEITRAALASTIARTFDLGEPTPDALIKELADKKTLLILDNYDRMSEEPDVKLFLETLLGGANGVRILVTGRFVKHVEDLGQLVKMHAGMLPAEAEELFRRWAKRGNLDWHDEHPADLGQVLKLCDYNPRAIELVSVRARKLPLKKIAEGLEKTPLDTIHGDETDAHLRRSLEWSYKQITKEANRSGFALLSLFHSDFTWEAAQSVCDTRDVTSLLEYLTARSFISFDGTARYRLDRLTRDFASSKLKEHWDAAGINELEKRFAGYYLDRAEQAIPLIKGSGRRNVADELERDVNNLEAALKWSVTRDSPRGLRIATDLWDFWASRGFAYKGRDALRSLLEVVGKESDLFARAAFVEGHLARHIGDFDRADDLFKQSRDAFLVRDDLAGAAGALRQLGILAWHRSPNDLATAQAFLDDALAKSKASGIEMEIAQSEFELGNLFRSHGRLADAKEKLTLSRKRFAKILPSEIRLTATACLALGNVNMAMGSLAEAKSSYKESLRLFKEINDKGGRLAMLLERIAVVAQNQGGPGNAAILLGAAGCIRETSRAPLPKPDQREYYDELVASLRNRLGHSDYVELYQQGWDMQQIDALETAHQNQSDGRRTLQDLCQLTMAPEPSSDGT